ncbi:MAG: hypothetical protein ACJARD_000810 [Alphaproteobacteria bacterium]|jgi:uncharacterized protein YbjQ (UPF0145 family)
MHIYNTPTLNDQNFEALSMVTTEVVIGINVIRDIFSAFTDFFGGRSGSYEDSITNGKRDAIDKLISEATKLNANAIINCHIGIETVGSKGSMICISVTGTAIRTLS